MEGRLFGKVTLGPLPSLWSIKNIEFLLRLHAAFVQADLKKKEWKRESVLYRDDLQVLPISYRIFLQGKSILEVRLSPIIGLITRHKCLNLSLTLYFIFTGAVND